MDQCENDQSRFSKEWHTSIVKCKTNIKIPIFSLSLFQLSYNPITTHGVQDIIQALYTKKSGLSFLDISVRSTNECISIENDLQGITVFSTSVRLAEKIAVRREFVMKYDCEIPVHDILGRKTGIS